MQSDDAGDIMTVRQRLYQAVRPGETYAGPLWSADLLAMLQEFDAQVEYIKKIADRLSAEDEEAGGLATQKLRVAEERLHAADVWAHMHNLTDHDCGECRAFLRATDPEKHEKKMDDRLAEARVRLAPDKRRAEWSASARQMMATVLPGDIDIVLAALSDAETARDQYKTQSETHLEQWVEQARNTRGEREQRIAAETRLNAALELDQYGGSHTYACKHGAGGGGCHQECARLRKVMLGD